MYLVQTDNFPINPMVQSLLEGTSDYSVTTPMTYVFVQAFLSKFQLTINRQLSLQRIISLINYIHVPVDACVTERDGVGMNSWTLCRHGFLDLTVHIRAGEG